MARNDDLRRVKNLTEARNAELLVAKARIEHTALHDSLTGLPNRRYLDQMLENTAQAAPDSGQRTALLHIDLDRFKQINDTLGHAAGDAMLVHAAKILRVNVRTTDFIARVGGDEFVVLCALRGDDPEKDAGYLAALADRIIRQMREPVMLRGPRMPLRRQRRHRRRVRRRGGPAPAARQRRHRALSGQEPWP